MTQHLASDHPLANSQWGFQSGKSTVGALSRKRQGCCDPPDNLILERVECFNYLGVILTSDLLRHVESICTKSQKLLGLLYHRFHKHAEPSALLQLYHSLVRTHLKYASNVWDPHLQRDIQLIENVQKFGLRIVANSGIWVMMNFLILVFLTFSPIDYITNSVHCFRLYVISSLFLDHFLYLTPVDAI